MPEHASASSSVVATPVATWLGLAWIAFGLSRFVWVYLTEFNPARNDFQTFYSAALSWRTGEPATGLSLNPPPFLAFTLPFTYLPPVWAFWTWTLVGLIAVSASLLAIHRQYPLSRETWLFLIGGIVALEPSLGNWFEGQVGWLLLYPLTKAFLSRAEPIRCGAWLGLAVAIKPNLAVLVACLPFALWPMTALVAFGISLVSFVAMGLTPWVDWIDRMSHVSFISTHFSASLFSVAARWEGVGTVNDLSLASWTFILGVSVLFWATASRAPDEKRWGLACLAPLLCQPLGWSYYWLFGLAPFLLTWRWDWRWIVTLGIFCLPWSVNDAIGGTVVVLPVLLIWWHYVKSGSRVEARTDQTPE